MTNEEPNQETNLPSIVQSLTRCRASDWTFDIDTADGPFSCIVWRVKSFRTRTRYLEIHYAGDRVYDVLTFDTDDGARIAGHRLRTAVRKHGTVDSFERFATVLRTQSDLDVGLELLTSLLSAMDKDTP